MVSAVEPTNPIYPEQAQRVEGFMVSEVEPSKPNYPPWRVGGFTHLDRAKPDKQTLEADTNNCRYVL